nr:MAG TPA: hypothetical protein [Caudoviricetes sp.]
MTNDEARQALVKTKSPYLKRDLIKFIRKEERRQKNGKRTKFASG